MTTIIAFENGIFTDSLATVNESPFNIGQTYVKKAFIGPSRDYVLAWAGSPVFLHKLSAYVTYYLHHFEDGKEVELPEEFMKELNEDPGNAGLLLRAPKAGEGDCSLFYICGTGVVQVYDPVDPIFIGSGAEFAKGAYKALDKTSSLSYNEKLLSSMKVAMSLDNYTGGPYIMGYRYIEDKGFFETKIIR